MTAKYTPGPWMLTSHDQDTSICASDGKLVVAGEYDGWMVPFGCREESEGIANARLIAAAPEMAHALELARCIIAKNIGDYHGILGHIEKVQAKARGEA